MERGEAFLEAESWEVDVLKALIFDMDGVLIDTEPLYFEAYRKAAESYGREYDLTLHRRIMGIPERDGLRLIVEHLGIEASLDEFRERVYVERRRIFSDSLKPNPALREALTLLKRRGYKVALATSTSEREARERLRKVELEDAFDAMLFGDSVKNGKPDPEIYLLVLERLGIQPTEAIVFEDSKSGVIAAKRAGVEKVVGVVHSLNNPDELLRAGVDELLEIHEIPSKLKEFL